ncbi:hypothetical protein RCC89_11180 [Cytophagaceae bacterium ABcell3]|nr:hypothetical protein RCC89_11180 [Cytophagaceae bacterium ABcell3]
MYQERLEELLKKKGIGPSGSKSLKKEELKELEQLFKNTYVSLTTKATMLTALLTLPPTPEEEEWIHAVKHSSLDLLPLPLQDFLSNTPNHPFASTIQKLIAHEELSDAECREGIDFILDNNNPDYLKGAFLEGERLKRESFNENKAFLESLWNHSERVEINTPILLDICDSYDGSNRTPLYSPFLAALLASLGYPTVLHGLDTVAPKMGTTSHQILKAAGKNPLKNLSELANDVVQADIAWGYADQSTFFPRLHSLKKMRKEMVKRPFLATFEKLLQPIHNKGGNHIITGYTHTHYREELVKQLQAQKKCAKAIVLKGAEGSTHTSMTRDTVCVKYDGKDIYDSTVSPEKYRLKALERKIDTSLTAEDSANEAIEAFAGKDNYAKHHMVWSATLIIHELTGAPAEDIAQAARASLASGTALKHWDKGCS